MKSLLGQTSVKNWSLELDSKGFAWLSLNVNEKSVNVINEKVIKELSDVIQILSGLDSLKGVALLSGKPSGFIYGADIYEFELLKTADDVARSMREVHRIFNSIESLAVPTCVGIDGVAVGGGLELALSFDQLIATAQPKTKLGFPEVNLGILPGWGGSGRAFARTGTQAALDLMLTGQLITSKAAFDISLIDQIVEKRDDLKIALDKWLNTQNGKKPKDKPLRTKQIKMQFKPLENYIYDESAKTTPLHHLK